MGIKVNREVKRQLLERGILGPLTIITEAAASCALDGETQCVWPTETYRQVTSHPPEMHGNILVQLPLKTPSMANLRLHWAAKARVVKQQREAVALALCGLPRHTMPAKVTLTRLAPRKLDDDNLASSLKGVRDAIAEWMKVDDGSDQYQWVCKQEKSKTACVRIEITEI